MVEGGGLENRFPVLRNGGSNPSPSVLCQPKALAALLAFSLLAGLLPAQTRELAPATAIRISQTDALLLYAADFAVAEDGVIFITDAKDINIKLYDPGGKLLKVIGGRGLGPEEFEGPYLCDYQAPFLSVLDSPKFKVHIYERKGKSDLVKVAEIPCMMCTSDVILSGKGVLVDAVAHDNGKKFFLTLRGFKDDVIKPLLPIERRYGYDSVSAYKANYNDLSMLTEQRGYLTISGKKAYFVFDVKPKVTAVDLDDLELVTFGGPSANYRQPRINMTIREAFFKPGKEDDLLRERNKVSYITGILSDEDMVGVLFSNYDAPSESWKLYLQRYDATGKFLSESLLRDAVNYGNRFSYFFQRESGFLYIMTEKYGDDATDDYRILGYKLR